MIIHNLIDEGFDYEADHLKQIVNKIMPGSYDQLTIKTKEGEHQLPFLWPNNINLGTTFYHNKTTTSEFDNNGSWEFPTDDNINNLKLRKKFDYQINTGYVMNNLYQIHGMTEQVPQDSIRFSLYGHIG